MSAHRVLPALVTLVVMTTSACSSTPKSNDAAPTPTASSAPSTGGQETAVPTKSEGAAAINGRWCDVYLDDSADACFEVKLPKVVFDSGSSYRIDRYGSPKDLGGGVFQFDQDGAPFGRYYPAGVPLQGFDADMYDYAIGDLRQYDRIWNSQDGRYAVRQGIERGACPVGVEPAVTCPKR
jgi:hypothetical protein